MPTVRMEGRFVCEKCGQIEGLFHKGCDGEMVEESRTVTETAWARTGYRRPKVLPKWADLLGADPDYLGGLSVEEFLNRSRGT